MIVCEFWGEPVLLQAGHNVLSKRLVPEIPLLPKGCITIQYLRPSLADQAFPVEVIPPS
jgi:hypothetical protein